MPTPDLAPSELDLEVDRVHRGNCPQCGGPGPVDLHSHYRVWSAFYMTRWMEQRILACAACARKAQRKSIGYCLLLGWWGIPWGLFMTPVQVVKNIRASVRAGKSTGPSKQMIEAIRAHRGAQAHAIGDVVLRKTGS